MALNFDCSKKNVKLLLVPIFSCIIALLKELKSIMRKLFIVFLLLQLGLTVNAQKEKKEDSLRLVQFSGVIVSSDSLRPLPFVNVYDHISRRGTTSDYFGYFSFVAEKGDTVMFSSVGYKRSSFVIPDTLTSDRYSMIHLMQEDTIQLATKNVYPWPSREQFAEAFVNTDIPSDALYRAQQNLSNEQLALIAERMPVSGSTTYKWDQQQRQTQLYYNGQAPPINFLNPIAWARFVDAWRKGKFKKQ